VGDGRVTVALAVALIAALAYVSWSHRPRTQDPLERRRVVVHTKDDRSLRGVLMHTHADSYVLARAEYLDEANPADLSGDVLVLRSNVSFVQILGGE
jgi:small nuclear ribonucleoprotein (snRNP)-like protein